MTTKEYKIEPLMLEHGPRESYWVRNERGQPVARLSLAGGRIVARVGDSLEIERADYDGRDLLGAAKHYVDSGGLFWLQLNAFVSEGLQL